jgi:pyrroloquinoline quinone biosynthesis protein B
MQIEVLGIAQDGGVPHVGCDCKRCRAARVDPTAQRYAASLLVMTGGAHYLVDATPDLWFQVPLAPPDGVFLTHEHFGHVGGLGHFGTEGVAAEALPVYCTPALAEYLTGSGPGAQFVENGNLSFVPQASGETIALSDGAVTAHAVRHRTEWAPTVAFQFEGDRSLLYLPDLDRWTRDALELVDAVDVAFVDGTFFTESEVDRYEAVPHPTISNSMDALADVETDVRFLHLNHTNPALDPESDARKHVEAAGFRIAERADTVDL